MKDSDLEEGTVLFKDSIERCKKDADAQDPLVDIIFDVLEDECTKNDSELVSFFS